MVANNAPQHNTRRPKWQYRLDTAREYAAMGANVHAISGKIPLNDTLGRTWELWQREKQTAIDVNVQNWRAATGIGVPHGPASNGWACVDIDDQPVAAVYAFLAAAGLPDDYEWCVQSGSGNGFHVWFRLPDDYTQDTAALKYHGAFGGLSELRWTGSQTLLPPSRHKARHEKHTSQRRYTWLHSTPTTAPTLITIEAITTGYRAIHTGEKWTPQHSERKTTTTTPHTPRRETLTGAVLDYALYIENGAQAAYGFSEPNHKNFSRLLRCPNPAHEDRNPSAAWNYTNHSLHCKSCGFGSRDSIAEHLGLMTFTEFVAERRRATTTQEPAPVTQDDETGKILPITLATRLVELLLNLHGDPWLNVQRRDLDDAGALVAVMNTYTEQVNAGQIAPDEPFTANKIATGSARGVSYATATNGLALGVKLGQFRVYEPYSMAVLTKEHKLETLKTSGTHYQRVPDSDALPALLATLAPHILRVVLVNEFPTVPVSAEYLRGIVQDVTPDDVIAIDERCAGLYAHHAPDRAAAMKEYERRLNVYRQKYVIGILSPSEKYPIIPFSLPAGVQTPNAAKFRNAVDDLDMADHGGERDAQARRDAARRTGRTLAAHTQAAKTRGIVPIPQADTYAVEPDTDVITQCAAIDSYALRGGSIALVAATGARVYVNEESGRDYDDWIEQVGGDVVIEIRRASIEKDTRQRDLEPDEQTAIDELSALQVSRAAKRTGAITAPKTHKTYAWAIRQGELRAAAFGLQALPQDDPRVYVDTTSGELFKPGDIWRGILSSLDTREAEPMPTFTAHTAAAYEGKLSNDTTINPLERVVERHDNLISCVTPCNPLHPVTSEITPATQGDPKSGFRAETVSDASECMSSGNGYHLSHPDLESPTVGPPELSVRTDKRETPAADPLWKQTGTTEAKARAHTCEHCHQPAAGVTFTGSWRCETHFHTPTITQPAPPFTRSALVLECEAAR